MCGSNKTRLELLDFIVFGFRCSFCDLAVLSSFALLLGVSLASVGQVKVKDRLV